MKNDDESKDKIGLELYPTLHCASFVPFVRRRYVMIEAELQCSCGSVKDLSEDCLPSPLGASFCDYDADPEILLTIHRNILYLGPGYERGNKALSGPKKVRTL